VCLTEDKVVQTSSLVACERLSISQVARASVKKSCHRVPNDVGPQHVWGFFVNPAYKQRVWQRQISLASSATAHDNASEHHGARQFAPHAPEEWTSIPCPIIEESLFEAVQEQLRENKQRHRLAKQGAKYLLQVWWSVSCCGYAMCGFRNAPRVLSVVGNVVHRMSRNASATTDLRGKKLEAAIWAMCPRCCGAETRCRGIRATLEHRQRTANGAESAKAPDADKPVQRQISKLIDAYSEG